VYTDLLTLQMIDNYGADPVRVRVCYVYCNVLTTDCADADDGCCVGTLCVCLYVLYCMLTLHTASWFDGHALSYVQSALASVFTVCISSLSDDNLRACSTRLSQRQTPRTCSAIRYCLLCCLAR
jgi:hypothetical protein